MTVAQLHSITSHQRTYTSWWTLTEVDRDTVLRLLDQYSAEERKAFLRSESWVDGTPVEWTVSCVSPTSGRTYRITTRYDGDTVALACNCAGFQYRRKCKHAATVAWAYYRWALGGTRAKEAQR